MREKRRILLPMYRLVIDINKMKPAISLDNDDHDVVTLSMIG